MKTLVTLCLLAFLCFLSYSSAAPLGPELVLGGSCCTDHSQHRIPKNRVKQLRMSPRHCMKKSLIVTTVRNKILCIDASWDWAQVLLEDFNKGRNASTNLNTLKPVRL
ncbi:C-C motif chemokine 22-like [Kryptolebias marmoratus]|uniref:C-C motif chemokine 22-like n=1 Tax=Kryptolebias marmoratus TaxID=37003 RepID=A0A3Q3AQ68_KRYMA|nr:C-C motif chemokine 22 [Kryptolebias marmoratus]XP_037835894.1 C-C motif chemokine 22-like [Kryptolebias marmoratus]